MSVPAPRWLITYEGTDVSDELARMTTGVEYIDHLKGKSDELTIEVADVDGRWREGWFPSAGDRLVVRLGYEHEPLLSAGEFQVDEIELDGPPDTVSIRALAAPMSGALRTTQSRAFEATSLREIATLLASELELELVGEVAEIPILRATQAGQTTVAFLRRLAEQYGYAFSIRPPQLIFYELAALELDEPELTLRRQDLLEYRLKSTVQNTYVACEVTWADPDTKEEIRARVVAKFARERIVVSDGTPAGAPPAIPARLLRQGVRGDDVRDWQTWLVGRGYETGGIDGIFGAKTRLATIAFQREQGLKPDGIAGPDTFRVAVDLGFGTASEGPARAEISGAVLRKTITVRTQEQAEATARALLDEANRVRASGSLTVSGQTRLVAGSTFELVGMGRLSGKYMVQSSKHSMDRSGGYVTEVEVTGV